MILLRYNSAVKAQDTTSSIVYSFPLRFELFDKESDCLKFWCVLHVKCARLIFLLKSWSCTKKILPSDKKLSLVTKKVYKLKLLFHFPTIICQGWGVGTGSKIGFWHFYAPAPFFTLALYLFARCLCVKVLLRLAARYVGQRFHFQDCAFVHNLCDGSS